MLLIELKQVFGTAQNPTGMNPVPAPCPSLSANPWQRNPCSHHRGWLLGIALLGLWTTRPGKILCLQFFLAPGSRPTWENWSYASCEELSSQVLLDSDELALVHALSAGPSWKGGAWFPLCSRWSSPGTHRPPGGHCSPTALFSQKLFKHRLTGAPQGVTKPRPRTFANSLFIFLVRKPHKQKVHKQPLAWREGVVEWAHKVWAKHCN